MRKFSFKKWRKAEALSYPQAAKVLGYTRLGLINIELGRTPESKLLELACRYLSDHQELLPTDRRYNRTGFQ